MQHLQPMETHLERPPGHPIHRRGRHTAAPPLRSGPVRDLRDPLGRRHGPQRDPRRHHVINDDRPLRTATIRPSRPPARDQLLSLGFGVDTANMPALYVRILVDGANDSSVGIRPRPQQHCRTPQCGLRSRGEHVGSDHIGQQSRHTRIVPGPADRRHEIFETASGLTDATTTLDASGPTFQPAATSSR